MRPPSRWAVQGPNLLSTLMTSQFYIPLFSQTKTFGGYDIDKIRKINLTPLPLPPTSFSHEDLEKRLNSGLTTEVNFALDTLVSTPCKLGKLRSTLLRLFFAPESGNVMFKKMYRQQKAMISLIFRNASFELGEPLDELLPFVEHCFGTSSYLSDAVVILSNSKEPPQHLLYGIEKCLFMDIERFACLQTMTKMLPQMDDISMDLDSFMNLFIVEQDEPLIWLFLIVFSILAKRFAHKFHPILPKILQFQQHADFSYRVHQIIDALVDALE
jgi:hypothetical protein